MVLPEFFCVVEGCRQRTFNVRRLIRSFATLAPYDDVNFDEYFGTDFQHQIIEHFYRKNNEQAFDENVANQRALDEFCELWLATRNNQTFLWIYRAALPFDESLAIYIRDGVAKVVQNCSQLSDSDRADIYWILAKMDEAPPTTTNPSWRTVKRFGIFPLYDSRTFAPPKEFEAIKDAIFQLWNATASGALLLHGEGGIGKTTLISALMHDQQFLNGLLGLETVFWYHGYSLSHRQSFDADNFLMELCQLFNESGLNANSSSVRSLNSSLGSSKKYLLIIDDAFKRNFVEIVSNIQSSTRCIVISRARREMGVRPGDFSVSQLVSLGSLSDSEVQELFRSSFKLPPRILEDSTKLRTLTILTCGLPLLLHIVHKLMEDCRTAEEIDKRYNKLAKTISEVEIRQPERPSMTICQLLRNSFSFLERSDRLKYYAFLFFDFGQAVHVDILAWLWKSNCPDETLETCDRFVAAGIARRAEIVVKQQPQIAYEIHAYLHEAALKDAIDQDVATDLSQLRMKMVTGKLLQKKTLRSRLSGTFPRSDEGKNVLQMAFKLRNWILLDMILESSDPSTLLKLCSETVNSKANSQQATLDWICAKANYEASSNKLVHLAFLKIVDKLLLSGFDTEIQALLVDNIIAITTESVLRIHLAFLNQQKTEAVKRFFLLPALQHGLFGIVKYLYGKFSNTFMHNVERIDALMTTASQGNLKAFKFLVEELGIEVQVRDVKGWTALCWAASMGHGEIVEYLLRQMSRFSSADLKLAFEKAAKRGHLAIVQLLHDKHQSAVSAEALLSAIDSDHLGTFKFCFEKLQPDGNLLAECFNKAAANGALKIVEFLIKTVNLDPNLKDASGMTPLISAALNNHLKVVAFLLKQPPCDPNLKGTQGMTPLIAAAKRNHIAIVAELVRNNVNLEAVDDDGQTATARAAERGHLKVVAELLAQGAEVPSNVTQMEQRTEIARMNSFDDNQHHEAAARTGRFKGFLFKAPTSPGVFKIFYLGGKFNSS